MKEMIEKKLNLSNWIKEGVKISDSNVGAIKMLEGKCDEMERTLDRLILENEEKFLQASKKGGKKRRRQKRKTQFLF